MAVGLFVNPRQYYKAADGSPLAGYKLYTYDSGTSDLRATYADADGNTENSNPIILDSAGSAVIYLTQDVSYKFVIKTAADVTVYTTDPVINYRTIPVTGEIDPEVEVEYRYALSNVNISTSYSDGNTDMSPNGSGVTNLTRPYFQANVFANIGSGNIKVSNGKGFGIKGIGDYITFTVAGSATNYIDITNSEDYLEIKALGDDTDIDLNITTTGNALPILIYGDGYSFNLPTSDGTTGQYVKNSGGDWVFGA
jgi:hypothetical protein